MFWWWQNIKIFVKYSNVEFYILHASVPITQNWANPILGWDLSIQHWSNWNWKINLVNVFYISFSASCPFQHCNLHNFSTDVLLPPCRGQSPMEADLNLLETARRCELFGVKMHPVKVRLCRPMSCKGKDASLRPIWLLLRYWDTGHKTQVHIFHHTFLVLCLFCFLRERFYFTFQIQQILHFIWNI